MLEAFLVLLVCCLTTTNCASCVTPNSTFGICIDINNCQHLLELKNSHPIGKESAKFLLDSQCGSEGVTNKVCCHERNETRKFIKSTRANRKPFSPTLADRFGGETEEVDCGTQYSVNKIYDGVVTQLEEFPWMGLLAYRSDDGVVKVACGGVLINQKYVLTAAHCVVGEIEKLGKLVAVRFGEYDTQTEIDCDMEEEDYCAPPPVDVFVESIHSHPDYRVNNVNRYHDIALLRLERSVNFTRFIQPICLANTKADEAASQSGTPLTVTGWGKTETQDSGSGIKLKTKVPSVQARDCKIPYEVRGVALSNSQLCAGGDKQDSCEGDSGGPLMWENENESRWYSIGIISFGSSPCATPGVPAVYTRVTSYLNWIDGVMQP